MDTIWADSKSRNKLIERATLLTLVHSQVKTEGYFDLFNPQKCQFVRRLLVPLTLSSALLWQWKRMKLLVRLISLSLGPFKTRDAFQYFA